MGPDIFLLLLTLSPFWWPFRKCKALQLQNTGNTPVLSLTDPVFGKVFLSWLFLHTLCLSFMTWKCYLFSPVPLFVTPWTVANQASLAMEFSRQEYWSGLPCLLQGIFPIQGLNLGLLHHRQILYCLSHQWGPISSITKYKIISWV